MRQARATLVTSSCRCGCRPRAAYTHHRELMQAARPGGLDAFPRGSASVSAPRRFHVEPNIRPAGERPIVRRRLGVDGRSVWASQASRGLCETRPDRCGWITAGDQIAGLPPFGGISDFPRAVTARQEPTREARYQTTVVRLAPRIGRPSPRARVFAAGGRVAGASTEMRWAGARLLGGTQAPSPGIPRPAPHGDVAGLWFHVEHSCLPLEPRVTASPTHRFVPQPGRSPCRRPAAVPRGTRCRFHGDCAHPPGESWVPSRCSRTFGGVECDLRRGPRALGIQARPTIARRCVALFHVEPASPGWPHFTACGPPCRGGGLHPPRLGERACPC
jgi:hypothetical protein